MKWAHGPSQGPRLCSRGSCTCQNPASPLAAGKAQPTPTGRGSGKLSEQGEPWRESGSGQCRPLWLELRSQQGRREGEKTEDAGRPQLTEESGTSHCNHGAWRNYRWCPKDTLVIYKHGKSWCQAAGVHTAGVPGLEDPPSVSPPSRAHPPFPASILTGPQDARAHEATDHQ